MAPADPILSLTTGFKNDKFDSWRREKKSDKRNIDRSGRRHSNQTRIRFQLPLSNPIDGEVPENLKLWFQQNSLSHVLSNLQISNEWLQISLISTIIISRLFNHHFNQHLQERLRETEQKRSFCLTHCPIFSRWIRPRFILSIFKQIMSTKWSKNVKNKSGHLESEKSS